MPSINHFAPCQENADSFPPLPEKVLAKIQQGKFIDFDMLLPQAFPPSTTDDYVMQVVGDDLGSSSISLVPRSQSNRAKVSDFYTWLQAWCIFTRAFCRYHRHRIEEILYYMRLANK